MAPILPSLAAGPVAGVSLATAFLLVFYLSTSSLTRAKSVSLEEVVTTVSASFFAGVGVVALFTAVGVYV